MESSSHYLQGKSSRSPLMNARQPTVESKVRTSPNDTRRSSGSPLLDYVKRTQMEALAHRTAARVEEIGVDASQRGGGSNSPFRFDGGDRENVFGEGREYGDLSPPPYQRAVGMPFEPRIDELSRAVGGTNGGYENESLRVPESAVRRNITQRRSRGRTKDEGILVPDASVVSRRPRSRSKDRRYSLESVGVWSPPEQSTTEWQDWRPATAVVKPKSHDTLTSVHDLSQSATHHHQGEARQDMKEHEHVQRSSQKKSMNGKNVWEEEHIAELVKGEQIITEVFSKQLIPDEEENPQLRACLLLLWDQRQATAVAMNASLFDDDMAEYAFHQGAFNSINYEMHTALVDSQQTKHDVSSQPVSGTDVTQTSSSVHTPSSPPDRGTIPRSAQDEDSFGRGQSQSKALKWRNVDSLPSTGHSVIKKGLKMSYKEDTHVFDIFLSYQGVEVSRTVNENLPLRILFTLAKSYLETDFYFSLISDQELDLVFDEKLLQRSGVLADVPLYEGAVVGVLYPIKPPMSGESPSHPTTKRDGQTSFGCHHQESGIKQFQNRGLPKDGVDLYDSPPANSLDPRSYDKIRQSFKCPKFSGQARDWKMWDKCFWRYLSIWELYYVLDPSFFDVMPLSAAKRRDNKLVYFVIEDAVQNSTLAGSYVRTASMNNGFEAYYTLHDGYVFAGATTATLLLAELSNFRFLPDESPTELCLRLDELFQELRDPPGDAAVTFIDTQKVGYLVNALRHERSGTMFVLQLPPLKSRVDICLMKRAMS